MLDHHTRTPSRFGFLYTQSYRYIKYPGSSSYSALDHATRFPTTSICEQSTSATNGQRALPPASSLQWLARRRSFCHASTPAFAIRTYSYWTPVTGGSGHSPVLQPPGVPYARALCRSREQSPMEVLWCSYVGSIYLGADRCFDWHGGRRVSSNAVAMRCVLQFGSWLSYKLTYSSVLCRVRSRCLMFYM